MDESAFKTKICEIIREEGGYGRRIEDQYAVGIPDMNLIPKGGPVFFCEAKIIRTTKWGATPRQMEELRRIGRCGAPGVIPCEMGFRNEDMIITLRRIGDPPAKWCSVQVKYWTQLRVSEFLHFCVKEWERLDG
jgi:hypothetical protein